MLVFLCGLNGLKRLLFQSILQNIYLNQDKNASVCILAVAFKCRGILEFMLFLHLCLL